MSQLMASGLNQNNQIIEVINFCTYLNSPVLDLSCNFGGEYSHVLRFMREIRMMSRVALDTDSPGLLGHTKDERPTFFGIEVSIRQNQQALVLLELDVFL